MSEPGFGNATAKDVELLDEAIMKVAKAEEDYKDAKAHLGKVMKRVLGKGAQRRAIAKRANVSDQTVSHMANGREDWRAKVRERAEVG